jgi:uncharacterized repeat protein (TIGR01451 family)
MKTLAASLALVLVGGCATETQAPAPQAEPSPTPASTPAPVQQAASVTIEPADATAPIGAQQVVTAVVRDKDGKAMNLSSVEWMLARGPGAVGEIVEVKKETLETARKVDNAYAVGGISDGKSSIVITSPFEGETHVIAVVPNIADPAQRQVVGVRKWLDAKVDFPVNAESKSGSQHVMSTAVVRSSNGAPLVGYDVNWNVISGPGAVFKESGKSQAVTETDENGVARATLVQTQATGGENVVEIAVDKAPDLARACCPGVTGTIAKGQAKKAWLQPGLGVDKSCPQNMALGDPAQFTMHVTNTSKVTADQVMLGDVLPQGFNFVSANPEARVEGRSLTWALGNLSAGESRTLTVNAVANAEGAFTNEVKAASAEGAFAVASCAMKVTRADLGISKTCPAEALVGDTVNYVVTLKNNGSGAATGVKVTDVVPAGMSHASGQQELAWNPGTLEPGASVSQTFTFRADKTGGALNVARASADRGLTGESSCLTQVKEPKIALLKTGSDKRYVNRPNTYDLVVSSVGSAPATNVVVSDPIPAGMSYVSSDPQASVGGGVATWNLGSMAPGAEQRLKLTLKGDSVGKICNVANAQADRNLKETAQACTSIEGIPALLLEVVDSPDPIEVGSTTTYTVIVTNQGSAAETNVTVAAAMPEEMELVVAKGPTSVAQTGRVLRATPVPTLAPGDKAIYTFQVKALRSSDARFAVQMTADQLSSPVNETEATRFYD